MSIINEFVKTLPDGLKTVVGQNVKIIWWSNTKIRISKTLYQNQK